MKTKTNNPPRGVHASKYFRELLSDAKENETYSSGDLSADFENLLEETSNGIPPEDLEEIEEDALKTAEKLTALVSVEVHRRYAISLVEREVGDELEEKLSELLKIARFNEQLEALLEKAIAYKQIGKYNIRRFFCDAESIQRLIESLKGAPTPALNISDELRERLASFTGKPEIALHKWFHEEH